MKKQIQFRLTFSCNGGKVIIWKTASSNKEAYEKAQREDSELLNMLAGYKVNRSVAIVSGETVAKYNSLTVKDRNN